MNSWRYSGGFGGGGAARFAEDDEGNTGSEGNEDDGEYLMPGQIVPETLFESHQNLRNVLNTVNAANAANASNGVIVPQPVIAAFEAPKYRGLSGAKGKAYPHLTRCINDPDGKNIAKVDWAKCTGQDIMQVLTCKYLGSGRLKTMAFYAQAIVKFLLTQKTVLVVDSAKCARLAKDLEDALRCDRGVLSHTTLGSTIVEICTSPFSLKLLRDFVIMYNKTHPLLIKPGLFPDISTTQQDQCRVAALMREPQLQRIFHELANPPQDRSATDNPDMRISAHRTKLYQEFCAVFNDPLFDPTFSVDIAAWCDIDVDVSAPAEERGWVWVACTMKDIKTKMTKFIGNFNDSGKNSNDLNDSTRDLEFFEKFAKGNIVVMYTWLAWDHGRCVPAWNSSLLPQDQRLDLGAESDEDGSGQEGHVDPEPVKSAKKSKQEEPLVDRATLGAMVEMQKSLFEVALKQTTSSTVSQPSVTTVETARALEVDALVSQATQVLLLMTHAATPDELKSVFLKNHSALLERIATLTTPSSS